MVSKCCGAKMTVECSDLSEEALRYLELPRELPLDIDCTHSECIRRQRDNDQRILNKWIKLYDIALKRIAELEAEVTNQKGRVTDLCSLFNDLERDTDKEIASLKEQLAVFTKDIPKGRFCYVRAECESIWCVHEIGGDCSINGQSLGWDGENEAYFKDTGCPVPAKEEQ